MQVLFVEDVPGTAYAGDIKNVKNGFARNYLLPKKLAVLATPDQMNRVARLQAAASQRRDVAEKNMSAVAEKIEGAAITIEVRAGRNNRLYGSITNAMIAEELTEIAGQEIDRRLILTEPIRQLGSYEVPVKLGFGFEPTVKVRVAPIGGALDEEATAEEVVAELEAEDEAEADAEDAPAAEAEEAVEEPPAEEASVEEDETAEEPPAEEAVEEEEAPAEEAPAESAEQDEPESEETEDEEPQTS